MKTSLTSTKVLFKKIYQQLDIYKQNEKSTQNLARQIWDTSSAPTKGMGKTLDKKIVTTGPTAYSHLNVSTWELYQLVSGLRLQL